LVDSDSRWSFQIFRFLVFLAFRLGQGELAEDKGTSFGLQGGYAINHQGSGPGRHELYLTVVVRP